MLLNEGWCPAFTHLHKKVRYGDAWADGHGSDILNRGEFILDDDEVIVKIEGRSGAGLNAIQFFTNKGQRPVLSIDLRT